MTGQKYIFDISPNKQACNYGIGISIYIMEADNCQESDSLSRLAEEYGFCITKNQGKASAIVSEY